MHSLITFQIYPNFVCSSAYQTPSFSTDQESFQRYRWVERRWRQHRRRNRRGKSPKRLPRHVAHSRSVRDRPSYLRKTTQSVPAQDTRIGEDGYETAEDQSLPS